MFAVGSKTKEVAEKIETLFGSKGPCSGIISTRNARLIYITMDELKRFLGRNTANRTNQEFLVRGVKVEQVL
jgi:hypothetical protein